MVLLHYSKETEKNVLIIEEFLMLNDKFSQLDAKNVVVKQAISLLSKRLVDME